MYTMQRVFVVSICWAKDCEARGSACEFAGSGAYQLPIALESGSPPKTVVFVACCRGMLGLNNFLPTHEFSE